MRFIEFNCLIVAFVHCALNICLEMKGQCPVLTVAVGEMISRCEPGNHDWYDSAANDGEELCSNCDIVEDSEEIDQLELKLFESGGCFTALKELY